jgi:multiple sugar transport system permease protein
MTYSYRLERRLVSTASLLVLALIAVYALTPIVWTVLTSLKLPRDILTVPPSLTFTPTLDNYQEALFKGGFARALLNSVIVGAGATLLSLAAGSLAAYALARFRFRGSNVLAYAILMTRMFPPVIAGLPLFILFQNLGLVDTHLGLILAHTTFSLPFVVWMMRSFFFTIPPSLEEAAMVDGCSQLGALVRVTLPLAAPGLAATSIFALIGSWNDLFFALILSRTNTPTLPVTAASFVTEQGVLWGQINAASVIIMAPIVVFTILMQKHLTRGLIAGGVKG